MCGIAGIASTGPADHADAMRRMRELLVHRGPDAAGERVDPFVSLGIRRLRVVDLITGDQPQSNEDGTVWTVFNGEIYNFLELREQLARRGHRFATTRSDTEVIVHLYEELGDRFAERLEGMFALAVWDARTRTLLLARDRMGKKPLLYVAEPDRITFASEHCSLLAGLRGRPEVDLDAIRQYLKLGYVPAPLDAFREVRKLEPAHVAIWREGRLSIRRYWSPPEAGSLAIAEADAVAELRRLLGAAVSRRLIADVPIGAFLSGGVDSSGVVATMAGLTPHVRTFSIGFDEQGFSELTHARRIAERYGTEHHEFIVRSSLDELDLLVRHYGEPYADSSALPTFFLSRLTRQHVTVALNGDGGDELFGGYERYSAAKLAARLDRTPSGLRLPLMRAVSAILPDSLEPGSWLRKAKRFLHAAALPSRDRYLRWLGVFDDEQLATLMQCEFADATAGAERSGALADLPSWDGRDAVAIAQAIDRRLYLPDDLLAKVDIASMANSLEVRCPLLDRELVEFAIALPTALKIRDGERKWILKKALEDRVPLNNMYRRKQGFAVPIGKWMRGDLRSYVEDTVLSQRARQRGYFRTDALERLVRAHTEGRADHAHRLWALLMLELWHRAFVDGPAMSEHPRIAIAS